MINKKNIKTNLLKLIRTGLNPLGIEITRFPDRMLANRIKLMNFYGINLVFDIGANKGQYAKEIIEAGYKGRIVSFEPLSLAFASLKEFSAKYSGWEAEKLAIGDRNGMTDINISENLYSSSILNITSISTINAPASRYVGKESVKITTVDTILDKYKTASDTLFVKLDVQGYEKIVLDGAKTSMNKITGFQLELSLYELYEDSSLYTDLINYLDGFGFTLMFLEPGFLDPVSGKLLQMDGIFFRKE